MARRNHKTSAALDDATVAPVSDLVFSRLCHANPAELEEIASGCLPRRPECDQSINFEGLMRYNSYDNEEMYLPHSVDRSSAGNGIGLTNFMYASNTFVLFKMAGSTSFPFNIGPSAPD